MNLFVVLLIILAIPVGIFLFKWLKPYFIKHDTTILFTGGLGSGKTLESVKKAVVLLRKQRSFKWKMVNNWRKFLNFWIKIYNRNQIIRAKKGKKHKAIKELYEYRKKPLLYSNVPIHFKPKWYSRKREWSQLFTESHILLLQEITEYSVILIDEFPQFINQFMWDEKLVQDNANEFITFFRHYIGGYLIINAQSEAEIEVHFRRKLNQAIWCYDFKKWFFGLFYTNRMCDIALSENISTMTTTQIEENTKLHFGLFPPKNTYDTRAYKVRYENILLPHKSYKWKQLQTYKVLRLREYDSPLDLETTTKQKENMLKQAKKLQRKEVKDNEGQKA